MEEEGTLRGDWQGQLRPPWRADVSSGQRMAVRLARGSIILSFFKSGLQEGKKIKFYVFWLQEVISFMFAFIHRS